MTDSSSEAAQYVRIQARYRGRLGVEVGIFVAVDHCRRAGILTAAQEAQYIEIDAWFQEHLPNPPFYDDGNSIGAVTWFKSPVPTDMSERLDHLRRILDAHEVPHDRVTSADPGARIYEDDFQIGVIPHERGEASPLPAGVVLAPPA